MSLIDRKIEEVNCLIEHAKLSTSDLMPVTQTIEFSPGFSEASNQATLLELDSTLLKTLKEGDKVLIRGDADDCVVLCTKNKTYEVREAETSNCLVLLPHFTHFEKLSKDGERSLLNNQVYGIHNTYLEVLETRPRLQKLKSLLKECPYQGDIDDTALIMDLDEDEQGQQQPKKKYTWDQLLDRIQCSENELQEALISLEVYNIYGFWQVLHPDYRLKICSNILSVIEENKWPLDSIPRDTVLRNVDESEPRTVYSQCVEYLFTATVNTSASGEILYAMNDDKVACLFGEALLRQVNKYNLNDFLCMWQQSVPEGITTSLAQLYGVALVDRTSSPEVIWHYPAYDMPEDIGDRFRFLFDTREKWTMDEIKPYIQDLATSKTTVNAILAKNCRAFTQDGIKYYTARLNK